MKTIRSKDMPVGDSRLNEKSTFTITRSPAGRSYSSRTAEGSILYNESGSIYVEIEKAKGYELASEKMAFLPPMSEFTVFVREDTSFHIYQVSVHHHFTEASIPLEWLYEAIEDTAHIPPYFLDTHEKISSFFTVLAGYIEDGLTTNLFYTLKARELMFLLKCYYTREQLAVFFHTLPQRHNKFSDFILENYRNYNTVKELAEVSCHSLSSFNKLFRNTFGQSPYSWIKAQKANDIYYDLTGTNKPIKELSADHGFGSLAQFSNFCKAQFGLSPRSIRKTSQATPGKGKKIKAEL